ncbi:hypothetical protein GCM10010277_25120 [Streptomyces longisporoflavus]|nr:hypothetical protein GCM10010277_25120 [Streptomyces longisporoflavus]
MRQRHLSRFQETEAQGIVHETQTGRHLPDPGEQPVRRARLVHVTKGAGLGAAPQQPRPVAGDQDEQRAAETAGHRMGLLPELRGRVRRVAVGVYHANVGPYIADTVTGSPPRCVEHLQVRFAGEAFGQSRPQQTGIMHEKNPDHVPILQLSAFGPMASYST